MKVSSICFSYPWNWKVGLLSTSLSNFCGKISASRGINLGSNATPGIGRWNEVMQHNINSFRNKSEIPIFIRFWFKWLWVKVIGRPKAHWKIENSHQTWLLVDPTSQGFYTGNNSKCVVHSMFKQVLATSSSTGQTCRTQKSICLGLVWVGYSVCTHLLNRTDLMVTPPLDNLGILITSFYQSKNNTEGPNRELLPCCPGNIKNTWGS